MKKERIIGIDIYRIVLAFVVFIFHSSGHLHCDYGFFQPFVDVGATSMTAFFLVSGFSLSYVYSNKDLIERSNCKQFYKKRFLGIMPLYYAVAIVYTALFIISGRISLKDSIVLIPIETLCLQSVFPQLFTYAHNQGTWFISDIILSYFAFPFLKRLFDEMAPKYKIAISAVISFILIYTPIAAKFLPISYLYTNPFFRFLEFILGMMIYYLFAYLKENGKAKFLKSKVLSVVLLLSYVFGVLILRNLGLPVDYTIFNFYVLPVFSLTLLNVSLSEYKKETVFSKVIVYLSNISYAFFLAQFFTWKIIESTLIDRLNIHNLFVIASSSLVVCLAISVLFYEVIQKRGQVIFEKLLVKLHIFNS